MVLETSTGSRVEGFGFGTTTYLNHTSTCNVNLETWRSVSGNILPTLGDQAVVAKSPCSYMVPAWALGNAAGAQVYTIYLDGPFWE